MVLIKERAPETAPTGPISRRTWLATGVMLVAVFMELMDVTMANVAVPAIQGDLGATFGQVQWVIAGYAVTFAVGLVTGGRLGDMFGRKRVFLAGMVGFVLTSVMCGLAPNPTFLVTSRVLQGLAAAIMLPQVLASISVWFPVEKRQAAFGLFGAVSGLGALSAPMIGGALINADLFSLGWRPIFLINLPIGIVAFFAARSVMEESKAPRALRLDPLGVVLSALGVFLVVFPVIQGREAGWPIWVWVMLGLAVPVFAVFVAVERWKTRRDGSPVVDLTLFRHRAFSGGLLVTLAFFAGVTAVVFVLMIFLQSGFGFSPFKAGLTLVPLALGLVVGSTLSIGLSERIGKVVLHIGCVVSAGSALWLASVIGGHPAELGFWTLVPPLALLGAGIGLVAAPLNNFVLAGLPVGSAGSASGMQSTMIQVGNALGVAILGVVFFGLIGSGAAAATANVTPQLQRDLVAQGLPPGASADTANGFATCFRDKANAPDPTATPPSCVTPGDTPAAVQERVGQAATLATRDDFSRSLQKTLYYDVGIFGLTFLLAFLIPRTRRQEGATSDH